MGQSPESGYQQVGPLRMYYEIQGSGDPLVLLHGGGSGVQATFGSIIPGLAKSHRVIGLEQEGHGHTADIDRPFSLAQMADDSADILAKLGVDSPSVFGFSNGGQVAMYLALRHPSKVKKLVLASTFYNVEGVVSELRKAWTQPIRVSDMPAGLREEYHRIAPEPNNLQRHIDKSQQMMNSFIGIPEEQLKRITAPTLIMSGDRDVVRLEHTLRMFKLIPGSRLTVLPGAHGAYIGELSNEHVTTVLPKVAVELIDEFLNGFSV